MDLEAVFEELGQFGKYQILQYALLTVPLIASSFEEISYIFTASAVHHRCLVPECEPANSTEFSPPWLPEAMPYNPLSEEPVWCQRYAVRNQNNTDCSSDNFLTNLTVSCDSFLFETKEKTVATEFKLLCEKAVWQRTMVGTVNNLGLITNYIIICYLSDRFGRKTVLISLSFFQGVLILLQSFSPTYIAYLALEYLTCFCSTFNSAFVLGIELVGGEKRVFANCLMNSLYSVGEVVIALVMWWAQDFRVLLKFTGTIKLTNVFFLWFVSESVHWYLIKNRFEEVVLIIKKIAYVNKKDVSEIMQQNLQKLQAKMDKVKEAEVTQNRSVFKDLINSPPLLKRFAICSLTWLLTVFVYFGLSLMSVTLGGNKYVNFILIALVEIPAYTTMWISMEYCKIGRKTVLQLTCFLASIPCLIYLFIPSDADVTRLCLFLLGKFAVTVSYTVVYEVGAELFPTELRQSMVGLCCAIACLGGLFAPQIPLLALYMEPMLLFFLLSVSAGCLSLLLPETQGKGLPGTIIQAVKIAN